MKLFRNPEVARLGFILLITLAVSLLLAVIGVSLSMRKYIEPLLTQQAAFIGAIADRYPDAEQLLMRQLSSVDKEAVRRGKELLTQYGYDDSRLIMETGLMQSQRRYQTWLFISIIALVFAALTAVFFMFIHRRYKTVTQLYEYMRDIAEGRDSLDIRDNGEGEFSILKNQIYTITTMLKEQGEALRREKLRLSDSIADISHQLKTPLTSLSMMTDLLREDHHPEMREQFLERIRSQLDRLEWLVSSLLKLAKLDAGTVTMKRETFPVSALIQRAVDTLSIPLEIKQQRVEISGDPGVNLVGDLEWTSEAVINILKNCIEHTPEHGEIRIHWETNPIYTRISISDNGEGIDPKDLPYIFNRFYRGQHTDKDSVGIGLAMALAIVKEQGGDIAVNSKPSLGTTFMITFYKQRI
jgi:signal transduction histidine kinase